MFSLPEYQKPDFNKEPFVSAPNVQLACVEQDGVAPKNYHVTSMYPEYFKIKNAWILIKNSRMDCVPVLQKDGSVYTKEFRNLKAGEQVIVGRTEDGSQGIYLHAHGFKGKEGSEDVFSFRNGRSRETAFSKDYENLFNLLEYEKEHGHIVWVLGPAVSFDYESRKCMQKLIENGYVHALLAGNALGTHDLEGGLFGTALGQDIYYQDSKPNGHYHHLDTINAARKSGSIKQFIEDYNIQSGIIYGCVKNHVPFVLAGSIRDDGPLPGVYKNVYEAQDAMREQAKKATTLICLATQLHTIATGNVTPSYTIVDGKIRPVFIYAVDISEFVLNKLRDRGTLEVTTMVSNVQDFLGKLKNRLIKE